MPPQPPTQQPGDNRNLIIAVVLSMAVFAAWFLLFPQGSNKPQQQDAQQQAAQTATPAPTTATAFKHVTADEALANSGPRVKVENDAVDGSIRLTGAVFDNLQLKKYRTELAAGSPEISLLEPIGVTNPYYASFGWLSDQNTAQVPNDATPWKQIAGDTLAPGKPVILQWDNGHGLVFTRTIEIDKDYLFTIKDAVDNKGQVSFALRPYGQVVRDGVPFFKPIWVVYQGPIGVRNGTLKEVDYSKLDDTKTDLEDSTGGWLGYTDHYWMTALVPDQNEAVASAFREVDQKTGDVGWKRYETDFSYKNARTLAPGDHTEVTHHLFAGAKVVSLLNAYSKDPGIAHFDLAVDWGWFWFFTIPIFDVLDWLYGLIGNFGVSILLLTVLMKALFFPLANRSYESMTKMKKIQPEMQALRTRYKDDAQKQQQEMLALYRREKVNPVAGCLPMLLQIPVFFSLYKVLYVTIEMRQAPFFGWIRDLSAPDPTSVFNLFGLLPFAAPAFLVLGALPIINGMVMWVQMKMNPAQADPIQQRMFTLMPLLFMFMLASFPAGLVMYWAWNGTLSITQQYIIQRRMGVEVHLFQNLKTSWPFKLFFRQPAKDAT